MKTSFFTKIQSEEEIPIDKKIYKGNWIRRFFRYIEEEKAPYEIYRSSFLVPHFKYKEIKVPVFAIKKGNKYIYTTNGKVFEGKFNRVMSKYCKRKNMANRIFRYLEVPTQKIKVFREVEKLEEYYQNYDFSKKLVIKPTNDNNGNNVFLNIESLEELISYARIILSKYKKTQVEEMIDHNYDFRVLSLGGEFYAAFKRIKANVVGDGKSNIQQLIERKNIGRKNKIEIDEETLKILKRGEVSLEAILEEGKVFYLKDVANFGQGGDFEEVTDRVGKEVKEVVKKVCGFMQISLIGFDFFSEDLSKNLEEGKTLLSEINSIPGLGMICQTREKEFTRDLLESYFK